MGWCSRLAAPLPLLPTMTMTTRSRRQRLSGSRPFSDLGCSGYEGLKKEEEGVYEIDDAKCKMGTMDIKLDKDIKVLLISRY